MFLKTVKSFMILFSLLLFVACNNHSSNGENETVSSKSTITGVIQKGPFKQGSTVKIYRLVNGEKGEELGTSTTNDKGEYSIETTWDGATLVEVVSGSYYNEVSAEYITIDENSTLSAIGNAVLNSTSIININVFTQITSKNVISNLKNGVTVQEALTKAKDSIEKTFSISIPENTNLEHLDITKNDDTSTNNANARLLSISSAIVSTTNPENTISSLTDDLETGEIDTNEEVIEDIQSKEKKVNLTEVATNLQENFGITAAVSEASTDTTAPTLSEISYSTTDATKDGVTVTFTSSDSDIVTPTGWTKTGNSYSKTYSSNANEEVVFKDSAGNETKKTVTITNIDKTVPTLSEISYSTTDVTKEDVTVTFTSTDTDIVTPTGWTKTGNSYTKVYSSNVSNEEVVFKDNAGNETRKTVTISNIDKTAPTVDNGAYSTTDATRDGVTVSFVSSDTDVTPSGWIKRRTTYVKKYAANVTNEEVIFKDSAGNETKRIVTISNIDKTGPTVDNGAYSTKEVTSGDVTVSFVSKDTDVTPSGWTKIKTTYVKTYAVNVTNEEVIFKDSLGNETKRTVTISNIDKSSLCSGKIINNVCYMVSTSTAVWSENICGTNKVLASVSDMESISSTASQRVSKLNLDNSDSTSYWLTDKNSSSQHKTIKGNGELDSKDDTSSNYYICKEEYTKPTVTQIVPASAATEVNTKAKIKVTFDKVIKGFDTQNVILKPTSGSAITTTTSFDTATKTLIISPSSDLDTDTGYTLELNPSSATSNIKDLYGNDLATKTSTFTTSATAAVCLDGFDEFPADSKDCYKVFDTKIAYTATQTACEKSNATLAPNSKISGILSDINSDTNGMRTKLGIGRVNSYWIEGEKYLYYSIPNFTFYIDSGNSSDKNYICYYTEVAPTITKSEPANGTTNLPINVSIKVTFSQNMKGFVKDSNVTLSGRDQYGANIVIDKASISSNVLTVTTTKNLANSTTFTLTLNPSGVSSKITDVLGNELATDTKISITTGN